MTIGAPKTKQTASLHFELANKMKISSKTKTHVKGSLASLALLISHELYLNLMGDRKYADAPPPQRASIDLATCMMIQ